MMVQTVNVNGAGTLRDYLDTEACASADVLLIQEHNVCEGEELDKF